MRARLIFLLCCVLCGCSSKRDLEKRQAKERFLKGTVAVPVERGPSIDVGKVATDPREMEKAQLLSATAVVTRLRSFRMKAHSELRARRGKKKVRLTEELEWKQGASGDFHTKVTNDQGRGLETWWVKSRFYLERRWGKARQRPVEEREYLKYRDTVWGGWSTVYRLFQGRLKFTPDGERQVGGRSARRFRISLASAPLTDIAKSLQPHPKFIRIGERKFPSAQRVRWRKDARPAEAEGTVDLDAASGVPLAVRFRGALLLPDKEKKSRLRVAWRHRLTEVGAKVEVPPPRKSIPEPVIHKFESGRFRLLDMVRIEDFLIDRWEYPNREGATPRSAVTWRQARSLCRKMGKRLCSIKEWQKACNSDRRRNRYPYGRIYRARRCNAAGNALAPSGKYDRCRGEFPVYDLVGNVAEWVEYEPKKKRKDWCLAGGSFGDGRRARCRRCIPRKKVRRIDARVGFRCCS